ncbi:hypothetical protein FACS1894125_6380 [Actinomycetota bacterium]|nr:hypothetical protein FACS1894125_6380 [Actinomycetota bacterium]
MTDKHIMDFDVMGDLSKDFSDFSTTSADINNRVNNVDNLDGAWGFFLSKVQGLYNDARTNILPAYKSLDQAVTLMDTNLKKTISFTQEMEDKNIQAINKLTERQYGIV